MENVGCIMVKIFDCGVCLLEREEFVMFNMFEFDFSDNKLLINCV